MPFCYENNVSTNYPKRQKTVEMTAQETRRQWSRRIAICKAVVDR
jgi:hypothetical protein